MRLKDLFTQFAHGMLAFMAIAGIIFLAVGAYIPAAALLIGAWNFDRYFRDRCLGFYTGKREDCSVDYVVPEIMHDGENLNNDDVIDAEWEDIK